MTGLQWATQDTSSLRGHLRVGCTESWGLTDTIRQQTLKVQETTERGGKEVTSEIYPVDQTTRRPPRRKPRRSIDIEGL